MGTLRGAAWAASAVMAAVARPAWRLRADAAASSAAVVTWPTWPPPIVATRRRAASTSVAGGGAPPAALPAPPPPPRPQEPPPEPAVDRTARFGAPAWDAPAGATADATADGTTAPAAPSKNVRPGNMRTETVTNIMRSCRVMGGVGGGALRDEVVEEVLLSVRTAEHGKLLPTALSALAAEGRLTPHLAQTALTAIADLARSHDVRLPSLLEAARWVYADLCAGPSPPPDEIHALQVKILGAYQEAGAARALLGSVVRTGAWPSARLVNEVMLACVAAGDWEGTVRLFGLLARDEMSSQPSTPARETLAKAAYAMTTHTKAPARLGALLPVLREEVGRPAVSALAAPSHRGGGRGGGDKSVGTMSQLQISSERRCADPPGSAAAVAGRVGEPTPTDDAEALDLLLTLLAGWRTGFDVPGGTAGGAGASDHPIVRAIVHMIEMCVMVDHAAADPVGARFAAAWTRDIHMTRLGSLFHPTTIMAANVNNTLNAFFALVTQIKQAEREQQVRRTAAPDAAGATFAASASTASANVSNAEGVAALAALAGRADAAGADAPSDDEGGAGDYDGGGATGLYAPATRQQARQHVEERQGGGAYTERLALALTDARTDRAVNKRAHALLAHVYARLDARHVQKDTPSAAAARRALVGLASCVLERMHALAVSAEVPTLAEFLRVVALSGVPEALNAALPLLAAAGLPSPMAARQYSEALTRVAAPGTAATVYRMLPSLVSFGVRPTADTLDWLASVATTEWALGQTQKDVVCPGCACSGGGSSGGGYGGACSTPANCERDADATAPGLGPAAVACAAVASLAPPAGAAAPSLPRMTGRQSRMLAPAGVGGSSGAARWYSTAATRTVARPVTLLGAATARGFSSAGVAGGLAGAALSHVPVAGALHAPPTTRVDRGATASAGDGTPAGRAGRMGDGDAAPQRVFLVMPLSRRSRGLRASAVTRPGGGGPMLRCNDTAPTRFGSGLQPTEQLRLLEQAGLLHVFTGDKKDGVSQATLLRLALAAASVPCANEAWSVWMTLRRLGSHAAVRNKRLLRALVPSFLQGGLLPAAWEAYAMLYPSSRGTPLPGPDAMRAALAADAEGGVAAPAPGAALAVPAEISGPATLAAAPAAPRGVAMRAALAADAEGGVAAPAPGAALAVPAEISDPTTLAVAPAAPRGVVTAAAPDADSPVPEVDVALMRQQLLQDSARTGAHAARQLGRAHAGASEALQRNGAHAAPRRYVNGARGGPTAQQLSEEVAFVMRGLPADSPLAVLLSSPNMPPQLLTQLAEGMLQYEVLQKQARKDDAVEAAMRGAKESPPT